MNGGDYQQGNDKRGKGGGRDGKREEGRKQKGKKMNIHIKAEICI